MNILKNNINCKQIYDNHAASNIPLNKIPDNYRQDKEFLRSGKYGFVSPVNCNFEQSQARSDSKEVIELSISDKYGLPRHLSVSKGNTLIIGEFMAEVLDRGLQFHRIYLKHGFVTKLVSFREFAALPSTEQTNPSIHYIVRFNRYDDIDDLPHQLSTIFSNIFVFALSGDAAAGIASTEIKTGSRASDILARLAITTASARKYLLPTLKRGEFLIIDGDHETLASISNDKV